MANYKKINMWSGPRNVSTALMYSFAQRSDTRVIDEPFYAHYLLQSGAEHPVRAAVLESQPKDPATIIRQLLSMGKSDKHVFLKNMAHHMINMEDELSLLMDKFSHVFLIRDPSEMLISLDKALPSPTLRDTAYPKQFELFEKVQQKGHSACVIDSRELLMDPENILSDLCRQLDIPFQKKMLSWEAGPIAADGVWADHWYSSVHQSTGFNPYKPKKQIVPDHLKPLYRECKPIYDKMFVHAIKANS